VRKKIKKKKKNQKKKGKKIAAAQTPSADPSSQSLWGSISMLRLQDRGGHRQTKNYPFFSTK
jgi:hypothetical protein